MKASEMPLKQSSHIMQGQSEPKRENLQKPPFRRVKDDTKPVLHDPILRSDPIETEEAVLRLPPFDMARSSSQSSGLTDFCVPL